MTQGSYRQFCPVAMAAEMRCRRWTIVLLRELVAGSTRFNDLRRDWRTRCIAETRAGISTSRSRGSTQGSERSVLLARLRAAPATGPGDSHNGGTRTIWAFEVQGNKGINGRDFVDHTVS
jgi:hypothetical protein